MRRPARITVGLKDWNGDAVITIVAGVALLACLLLPWANEGEHQGLNWSLSKSADINGVMHTAWGVPALAIALVVLAAGVLMLSVGPRRFTFLLGIVVFVAGLAAGMTATSAAMHALRWEYATGIGAAATMLIGLLLLPIGFASAAVGFMVAYWAPKQAPVAAQPAPVGAQTAPVAKPSPEAPVD